MRFFIVFFLQCYGFPLVCWFDGISFGWHVAYSIPERIFSVYKICKIQNTRRHFSRIKRNNILIVRKHSNATNCSTFIFLCTDLFICKTQWIQISSIWLRAVNSTYTREKKNTRSVDNAVDSRMLYTHVTCVCMCTADTANWKKVLSTRLEL